MKSFIALITLSLVAADVFDNLELTGAVSNRLPGQISGEAFVRSLGGMPYRRILQRNRKTEIQKSGRKSRGKSRRQRNTITNEHHFDQPLLYRTNPTYAMRPEVMERIRFPHEMKPTAFKSV